MTNRPTTRRNWLFWARLAWLTYALFLLGANLWILPYRLSQSEVPGWSEWSEAERLTALADLGVSSQVLNSTGNIFNLLVPALYLLVAGIIFWKKSSEPAGLWWASVFLTFWNPFSTMAELYPAWKLAGDLSESLGSALLLPALYSFPDGRFKPGWTRWAALAQAAIQVWRLFQPELYSQIIPILMIGIFLSIPLAQVYRYARLSSNSQRQQIKWVVFGLAVCALPLVIFLAVLATTPSLRQPTAAGMAAFLVGNYMWLLFGSALPVTLLIAIFRSGLWDIDVVIRKTLVYALLSGLLGLVYFGGVTLLQSFLTADHGPLAAGEAVSGQPSPVVIVVTTLAIAALFNPLRRRIQDFIDRRFYRRKYDAEKALAEFALAARSQTDLPTLTISLINVVQDTVQPEQVSLWLKQQDTRSLTRQP
jgi:hypothetical protein